MYSIAMTADMQPPKTCKLEAKSAEEAEKRPESWCGFGREVCNNLFAAKVAFPELCVSCVLNVEAATMKNGKSALK